VQEALAVNEFEWACNIVASEADRVKKEQDAKAETLKEEKPALIVDIGETVEKTAHALHAGGEVGGHVLQFLGGVGGVAGTYIAYKQWKHNIHETHELKEKIEKQEEKIKELEREIKGPNPVDVVSLPASKK
jgi:hypothetical protein